MVAHGPVHTDANNDVDPVIYGRLLRNADTCDPANRHAVEMDRRINFQSVYFGELNLVGEVLLEVPDIKDGDHEDHQGQGKK